METSGNQHEDSRIMFVPFFPNIFALFLRIRILVILYITNLYIEDIEFCIDYNMIPSCKRYQSIPNNKDLFCCLCHLI